MLAHDFTRLAPGAPYVVRIVPGPADPLAGAKAYRAWLQASGGFVSLTEKIAALPDVARLGGAPHIYLWGRGPLKPEDMLQWRAFVRLVQQKKDDPGHLAGRLWQAFDAEGRQAFEEAFKDAAGTGGFVSTYSRAALTRAVNDALRRAVPMAPVAPLPGGHDPAAEAAWAAGPLRTALTEAFGPMLAPPERWGGGLSLDTVSALQKAGLHPRLARRRGLARRAVASARRWPPPGPPATSSAPMTATAAPIRRTCPRPGRRRRWAPISPRRRLCRQERQDRHRLRRPRRLCQRGGGGALCQAPDGGGGLGRRAWTACSSTSTPPAWCSTTMRRAARRARGAGRRRAPPPPGLCRVALGLVVGSEGGSALFAPQIAFAHGMTTQPFAWMAPEMKDKASPYYRGNYWPPETPSLTSAR